jgi:hypothetical protein
MDPQHCLKALRHQLILAQQQGIKGVVDITGRCHFDAFSEEGKKHKEGQVS